MIIETLPHKFKNGQRVKHVSTGETMVVIGLILEFDSADSSPDNYCVGYRAASLRDGVRCESTVWETELAG